MSSQSATVETLTAEVRVLMVGNRQVTLSVYRQLDLVDPAFIEPFGRVRSGEKWTGHREVVGRLCDSCEGAGSLVRSRIRGGHEYFGAWSDLPLIVLAGLR